MVCGAELFCFLVMIHVGVRQSSLRWQIAKLLQQWPGLLRACVQHFIQLLRELVNACFRQKRIVGTDKVSMNNMKVQRSRRGGALPWKSSGPDHGPAVDESGFPSGIKSHQRNR